MAMTRDEHEALWDAVRANDANWRPGHNAITDLDPEERRQRLGFTPGPDDPSLEEREALGHERHAAADMMRDMPLAVAAVDWRNKDGKNFVTIVKDQKNCGSCVAFGTAATMESRARIITKLAVNDANGGALPDLSPAHLFYCGNPQSDKCAMGWWPQGALLFANNTGVVPEFSFPYTPGNQACNPGPNAPALVTKISASHAITSAAEMKTWLADNGPLIACLNIYRDLYAYTGGVYVKTSNEFDGGHCVSCVGYDETKRAWLCKNSWGTGWGEGGFFWIGYGQCGIDAQMWAVDNFSAIFTPHARPGRH